MKKLVLSFLSVLGIAAFAEQDGKKILTKEQRENLVKAYGEDLIIKFEAGLATDFADEAAAAHAAIEAEANVVALQAKINQMQAVIDGHATTAQEKLDLENQVILMQATINILQNKPVAEPAPVGAVAGTQAALEMNDKFLLGQNVPHMAIDDRHPYNKRAYASLMLRHGIEIPAPTASSLDYESLKSDLGDFYRIRKQDRIQSFLMTLPSLESIFPLESGYQDRAELVNVFLTDSFSQADNTSSAFDSVVKGGYKFEPEEIRMFDVMFAHKFTDLKKLEKNWLGYLNKEGSDTMKWSFIEYIMIETGKALHNEQQIRRISGVRVNPTLNVPGKSLDAADGLRQFLKNQLALFKLRPFVMGEWTPTTISEYIRKGTSMVPIYIRDTGRLVLYMSPDALVAYHTNNRALYGLVETYATMENVNFVLEYPNVKIITVPNMAESQRMFWTFEGNIALFEDQPGEMYKFYFEQVDWSLKVWSNWKESLWAYLVGRKYNDLASIPSDYSTQMIFLNDVDYPVAFHIPMPADDVTPSVAKHTSLISVANTGATAITNIDDAVVGVPIHLMCGNGTHAINIAKAGNFSLISAAWDPVAGDEIVLVKRSDGKFVEVERKTASSGVIKFTADDATPSVKDAAAFMTVENANALAITTFDDSIYDRVYTIWGAGVTHPATIANAGNFVLTAAMTLSAGTYIILQKSRVDDKFYEITRG